MPFVSLEIGVSAEGLLWTGVQIITQLQHHRPRLKLDIREPWGTPCVPKEKTR